MNSFNIDILCLTEHWLKSHELMFNFSNHQVGSSFCRSHAVRGGSLIFLNKHIKFKNCNDIVCLSVESHIEVACVELERIIVISVYSPPSGSFDVFEKVMDDILFKVSKSNKTLMICGDFNVNLLETYSLSTRLTNLFNSHNLKPLFMEPTRITETSANCIDNIFAYPNEKIVLKKL